MKDDRVIQGKGEYNERREFLNISLEEMLRALRKMKSGGKRMVKTALIISCGYEIEIFLKRLKSIYLPNPSLQREEREREE